MASKDAELSSEYAYSFQKYKKSRDFAKAWIYGEKTPQTILISLFDVVRKIFILIKFCSKHSMVPGF